MVQKLKNIKYHKCQFSLSEQCKIDAFKGDALLRFLVVLLMVSKGYGQSYSCSLLNVLISGETQVDFLKNHTNRYDSRLDGASEHTISTYSEALMWNEFGFLLLYLLHVNDLINEFKLNGDAW